MLPIPFPFVKRPSIRAGQVKGWSSFMSPGGLIPLLRGVAPGIEQAELRLRTRLTMPLPNDEKLIALSEEILKQLEAMFGPHPEFRPVHAKGILLTGTFTPSSAAVSLTRAQHAVQASTPVTVRFSDGTGVPLIPDNDPHADPRGMAIRFNLAEHVHTD